jgi:hypothetical protein
MIEPNFDLFLWCIFVFYALSGVLNVLFGATGVERKSNYGVSDVIAGLIMLLIIFLVCVL